MSSWRASSPWYFLIPGNARGGLHVNQGPPQYSLNEVFVVIFKDSRSLTDEKAGPQIKTNPF
jgi:hypothetical protein